jgi:DNA (cytosine-5)-methyltransferase 1
MRAISLFSGAGGLDLGCERAGFETVVAVEYDDTARRTLLENAAKYFPTLTERTVFSDIVNVGATDLLDASDLEVGEVDLVHGGPPCTPFSKSGYWLEYKRAGADPKASLVDEFVRVVAEVQPKMFLMENVYGLAYNNQNREVFARFIKRASEAGYLVDHKVLLAADYGVPQRRQRLFCIGLRADLAADADSWSFVWPTATYSGPHETRGTWDTSLPPHITAAEAFASLPDTLNVPEPEEQVRGTYAEELAGVPPGSNYLYWTAERGHPQPRFRWRSRFWNFLLKLHPDKPSPTIQGQPGPWVGPFHWEGRRLRVPEVRRLMTFPDDYSICGSRRDKQLQLGNAVPPLLAEVVANAIARQIEASESAMAVGVAA